MADAFDELCQRIAKIDLFGPAGDPMPGGDALSEAVKEGAPLLPHVFRSTYVEPLLASLPRLAQLQDPNDPVPETLTGA
jgi:hypothetical protein